MYYKKSSLYLLMILFSFVCIVGCQEERFGIRSGADNAPDPPTFDSIRALYGGARIFYTPPANEDVLQIVAEFDSPEGKTFRAVSSFYTDSIDIYGLGQDKEYTIRLYAQNRAGKSSQVIPVPITPLESSIIRVARTIQAKPAFSAFYVDWHNELRQSINVVVDFEFTMQGVQRNVIHVFSSNREDERQFIRDLDLGPDDQVKISITVEDLFGNKTEPIAIDPITLFQDMKIPKANWSLPLPGDSIDGLPMVHGSLADGRIERVIDDIIDFGGAVNYINTGERGRTSFATGNPTAANGMIDQNDWNLFIDLGAYYRLSRIVTHQRHSGGDLGQQIGHYYGLGRVIHGGEYNLGENVGHYRMWYLDEDVPSDYPGHYINNGAEYVRGRWVEISEHVIPIPQDMSIPEIIAHAQKGDQAYMYPDEPGFTPPVRWFRYEPLFGFRRTATGNENRRQKSCLSEITLYGEFYSNK